MSHPKLSRMANQIAAFFQAYPAPEATAGIHDHLVAFWTPKMRAQLAEHLATGTTDLHPLVVAALQPRTGAHSPAEKEAAGPSQVGEIGASDAG